MGGAPSLISKGQLRIDSTSKCVCGGLSAVTEEVVAMGHRPPVTIGGRDSGSTHSCSDISLPSSRPHQRKPLRASGKSHGRLGWSPDKEGELAGLRSGV